jgi:hypothetical protein
MTDSGLPRLALRRVVAPGPAPTWRSPEFSMVTVSLIERPICGWFFSSFLKKSQP